MTADLISTQTLKELCAAGAVRSASLVGAGNGFALVVRYGLSEKALQAKRGHVRVFRSLNSAARTLKGLGLSRAELDVSQWDEHQPDLERERARERFVRAVDDIHRRNADKDPAEIERVIDEAVAWARFQPHQKR